MRLRKLSAGLTDAPAAFTGLMSVLSEVTTRISCGRASSRTSRTISSSAELAAALGAWTTMIDDGLDWRGWRSLEHHYRRQALRIGSCCAAVTTHGSSSPTPWRISDLSTGSKRSELPSWTVHLMPTVNADLRNYPAGLGAVLTSGSAAPPA